MTDMIDAPTTTPCFTPQLQPPPPQLLFVSVAALLISLIQMDSQLLGLKE